MNNDKVKSLCDLDFSDINFKNKKEVIPKLLISYNKLIKSNYKFVKSIQKSILRQLRNIKKCDVESRGVFIEMLRNDLKLINRVCESTIDATIIQTKLENKFNNLKKEVD